MVLVETMVREHCVRGSEIARKDLKLRTEVPKRMFYYGHYQEDMPLRYVMEDDM